MTIKDDNNAINERHPFGEQPEQHAYILEGINDLRCRVNALPNSREKSTMLTKLDELRHWNHDHLLSKIVPGARVKLRGFEEGCIIPDGWHTISGVNGDGSFHVGGRTAVWFNRIQEFEA